MRLAYAIKFVADMDAALAFHRDTLGLELRFQSPFWSEFETGETILALHPASDANPAGAVQLGYHTPDLAAFFERARTQGVHFSQAPTEQHGRKIGRFIGSEGEECSLGEG